MRHTHFIYADFHNFHNSNLLTRSVLIGEGKTYEKASYKVYMDFARREMKHPITFRIVEVDTLVDPIADNSTFHELSSLLAATS